MLRHIPYVDVLVLFGLQGSCELLVDYCQFGRAFRKRTKVVLWNISRCHNRAMLCKAQKENGIMVCSQTGLPHEELSGAAKGGGFRTRRGEEYPVEFAQLLASLLLD